MPVEPKPTTNAPRLWSRRKILLIFLVPPLLLLIFLVAYDERLEPAPDLVLAHPGASLASGQNGLAMLHAACDPLPEVDRNILAQWHYTLQERYLWDDGLVKRLNPSGRDLRQDLTDALAAPEWVEQLRTVRDFLDNKNDLPNSCFEALTATAMQKARGGERQPAISLIRDLRRLAARQFQGSWSWAGLRVAMWRTQRAMDFTCRMVAEGGFNEQELAELASIWGSEDLERSHFANATAGEALFLAAMVSDEAVKEYRFGYWERHGAIYPSVSNAMWQRYLGLMIQPCATMNEAHRILRSVREGALATSKSREGTLFDALQKSRSPDQGWSMIMNPNAGGKFFRQNYLIFPSLVLETNSRLHLFSIRAMRVWIALRRWQQGHEGKLPAGLTELVPDYLASIPHDPWDDQPLRWDAKEKVIFGTGTDWISDAPMAADLERQWISIKMEGSLEYKNVALRFDLPPPATPTVAWPSPLLVPKKKPAPKSGP